MSWSKEFSTGGETKRHESKLFFHNIKNLFMIASLVGLVLGGTWYWHSSGPLKRKYFFTYAYSYWFTSHPGEPKTAKKKLVFVKDVSNYWLPVGEKPKDKDIPYRMGFSSRKKGKLLSWPDGKPVIEWRIKMTDTNAYADLKESIYQKTFPALIGNFFVSVMWIAGIVIVPVAFSWIRTGREKMLDRFIRGTKAVVPKKANRLIQKAKQHGGLKFGEVWLPRGTESQHMLMVGGSGSGKTSAMFQLLYQLRELEAKVLVCDTKLDFVSTFYDPQTDFIASPLDERSIHYSLFAEGCDVQSAESTASSLVQEDYQSKQWEMRLTLHPAQNEPISLPAKAKRLWTMKSFVKIGASARRESISIGPSHALQLNMISKLQGNRSHLPEIMLSNEAPLFTDTISWKHPMNMESEDPRLKISIPHSANRSNIAI